MLYKIPRTSGIYYFYDKWDDLLYIGVAKILRSRICKHYIDSKDKGLRSIPTIDKVFDRVYWIEIEEISYNYVYLREILQIEKLKPLFNMETGRDVYYSFRDAELIRAGNQEPAGIETPLIKAYESHLRERSNRKNLVSFFLGFA